MTFTVEPLLHKDFDDFIQVWWDAFVPEHVDQVLPQIYPQGLTPELQERLKNRIHKATNGDLEEFCFIARDDDTSRIVGVAWWMTLEKPSSPEDEATEQQELAALIKSKNAPPEVPGANYDLGDAFFKAIYIAEKDTIRTKNVPYITLQVLGVLPEYGRRGIGSQLLEKGLERVDKLNVWTFLIAASTGRGLYEKFGFEVAGDVHFDGRKYGGRSEGKHWSMCRPAQNRST